MCSPKARARNNPEVQDSGGSHSPTLFSRRQTRTSVEPASRKGGPIIPNAKLGAYRDILSFESFVSRRVARKDSCEVRGGLARLCCAG
jgi:hypothetical protein